MQVSFTPYLHIKTETYVMQQIVDFFWNVLVQKWPCSAVPLMASYNRLFIPSFKHTYFHLKPKLCTDGHMYFLLDFSQNVTSYLLHPIFPY